MAENQTEIVQVPLSAPPANHGHTLAAWLAMAGVMVGAAIAGLGVAVEQTWLFIAGLFVVFASLVAGYVLRNMGYGQKSVAR